MPGSELKGRLPGFPRPHAYVSSEGSGAHCAIPHSSVLWGGQGEFSAPLAQHL